MSFVLRSAGQKSRLTLAGAFWTKPHVIFLDEPTNYLDMVPSGFLNLCICRITVGPETRDKREAPILCLPGLITHAPNFSPLSLPLGGPAESWS